MRENTLIAERYELRTPLGRGAMGEVWEGYDRRLDRRLAVKLIHRDRLPGDADYDRFLQRFLREARLAAKLDHPGVPTVHDVGEQEECAFLAMQLIQGHDLSDVLAEGGPLPVPWVAAIGAQVCSVLAAAHAASLVHRDLKPRNLMLCPDGSVKVLDFGIAMVVDALDTPRLTTTGTALGTPAYMAPEQASGGDVGPGTDLYALGCVMHELLTGSPPFTARLPIAVATQHLNAEPPPLRPARPDVPRPLADLVSQLLAKRPADRPADAVEVYHRLLPLIGGQTVDGARPQDLGPTRPYHYPLGPVPVHAGPVAEPPALVTTRQRPSVTADAAVSGLDRERERAVRLVDEGRVTQAGQVLAEATREAAATLGGDHPDVVDARLALAHVYLLAGDQQRALPELERLLPELEKLYGAGHDFVREAKRGIAGCHLRLGDHARASAVIHDLLADPRFDLGTHDPRTTELRELLNRLEGSQT